MSDNNRMKDNQILQDNLNDTYEGTITTTDLMQTDAEEMKVVSKKKLNGKLVGSVAVAVACLELSGVLFAKAVVPTLLPQVFVLEAIKTTQEVYAKEAKEIQEITGINVKQQIIKGEALQTNFALTLNNITGEGAESAIGIVKGLGVSTEVKRNLEADKVITSLAITQNNLKLVGADFYRNGPEVGIAIKELFDKILTVNMDTFVADYNASALLTMLGEEPIDQAEYNAIRDYFESASKQKITTELIQEFSKRNEVFFKTAEVTYIGKTDLKIGDKNNAYKTFKVAFKEDDIKSYLKDTFTLLVEDKTFGDYIATLDALEAADSQQKISETIKMAKEEFNKSVDELDFIGFNTKLMIDEKKHIVKAIYEADLNDKGEKTKIKLDLACTGSRFITDAVKILLSVKSNEEQVDAEIISSSNYGSKEDKLDHKILFALSENGKKLMNMNVNMVYDTKEKENNLALKAEIKTPADESYVLDSQGTMNVDKGNKAINIDMNNIILSVKSPDFNNSAVFSGKYGMKSIQIADIAFKQEDTQQLFKMTQEELSVLEEKVSQGMMQLSSILLP